MLGLAYETILLVYFRNCLTTCHAVRVSLSIWQALYRFHTVQAVYEPFSQLSNRLTWFLNGTTLLYWKQANQLRNWMTGLQIVQVCNRFIIMYLFSTASHLLLSLSARVYGPHSCVLTSCTVMCIAFSEGGSCIHIYSIVPKNFGHCLCTLPFDSSKQPRWRGLCVTRETLKHWLWERLSSPQLSSPPYKSILWKWRLILSPNLLTSLYFK